MARRYLLIVSTALYCLLKALMCTVSAQEPSSVEIARLLPSPLYFALLSEAQDLFEPMRLETLPDEPQRSLPPFLLETAFQTEMPEPLQGLLQYTEPRVLWSLTATSLSSDTWMISEGAFASGPPESLTGTRPLTDWHHQIRLVHASPWKQSRYGIEYRYDGNALDQELVQLWSEWKFGAAKLKTSLTALEDNIGKAPDRARLATLENQIAVDVAMLADTRFGLSYSRASIRSTWDPWSYPFKHMRDKVGVSLAYQRPVWKAKLASTYISVQDQLAHRQEAITLRHKLSLAYHLVPELTITPSMHYKQKWTHASQTWTTTPSVGLSITHHELLKDVDITAKSSYTWSQNPRQTVETRSMNTTGRLAWHLKRFRLGKTTVSFEVSYVNVSDRMLPINSYEGLTGGLSLRIQFS